MQTIAAISTPLGAGGISIIRLSGKDSLNIARKVFFLSSTKLEEMLPRMLYLGEFKFGTINEKCLGVYFKNPNSYTGEDVFEFQCHGGVKITQLILQALLDNGAAMATEGEFTKRAFLNGKLSLDQAEGVIDTINAESESEIKAAYDLVDGKLKNMVITLQDKIKDVIAKIEVALDYPDEDLEEETTLDAMSEIKETKKQLEKIINTAQTGRLIKEGTRVLIVGKTNVGKSSLMNALLNFDRAIVTNIKGTTRDVLEGSFEYKGAKFVIIDTAGIRESQDLVEQIGVEKAKKLINSADVIVAVFDNSQLTEEEDVDIIKLLYDRKCIFVVNKSDLPQRFDISVLPEPPLYISAQSGENLEQLKQLIYQSVFDASLLSEGLILTHNRHLEALSNANKHLKSAGDSLDQMSSLDLVVLDIKNAWLSLGAITGETEVEEIINTIFSKFCVGK